MGLELRWCDPSDPLAAVDEDVALLSLTHVDFRTGAMFDMAGDHGRRARARCPGAVGPVPLRRRGAGRPDRRGRRPGGGVHLQVPQRRPRLPRVPLGGPGAPGRRRGSRSPAGWATGTRSRWRATTSRPTGIGAFASGTPPVLALSALEAALEEFEGVSVADLRARSLALTDLFISLVEERLPGVFELAHPARARPARQPGLAAPRRGVRRHPGADRPRGHRRLPRPRRRPLRLRPALQHRRRRPDRRRAARAGDDQRRAPRPGVRRPERRHVVAGVVRFPRPGEPNCHFSTRCSGREVQVSPVAW